MNKVSKAVGGQKAMCCFSQLFDFAVAKSVGIYFLLILTVCIRIVAEQTGRNIE